MADKIIVDPDFLAGLASRYGRIAHSLRDVKNTPANLAEAPTVESAYQDFQSRWDWTREKFAEVAEGLADALVKTNQGFVEVDAKIAATLDEGA